MPVSINEAKKRLAYIIKKRKATKRYFDIHPPVFYPSAFVVIVFIFITLIVGEPMAEVFSKTQNGIADSMGWFYILVVNFFLFFMIYLAISRLGRIRLGGKEAKPDFTRLEWFAMLFSAGMGIGILFWSVAEPVFHFLNPALTPEQSQQAAQNALNFAFLHWGLHAWGIYALVAMSLAFFSFNKKMPLAINSVFYPIFGNRVYGLLGNIIEILAVVATLFGLATSLGFGVQQVNAGLNYLFGINNNVRVQALLILIITLIATISVVSGLNKGVKRLSEMNINLGAILLVFVIIFGPTLFILDSFVQNTGNYLHHFFEKAFWTESYKSSNWQNQWTIFYWAWWIAWSPFVGMFIARVSKGRSVREFVLGVLFVPTVLTFLWLTTFGGSAIFLEMNGIGDIAKMVQQDVSLSLYSLLENFPLSTISNFAAMILIISFFVTSSDSGSLVVDSFTSGGKLNTPIPQRVFWAFTIGGIAAVLLMGGGLNALQTASIVSGLPFAVILVLMSYSLYKGLNQEYLSEIIRRKEKEKESYRDLVHDIMKRKDKEIYNNQDEIND